MSMPPPARPTSDANDALYRRVSWRLIPLLMLCYGAAFLDRANLGFAKLQMSAELKFSESVFGLGAGMFFIGYFLFEVPSNLLLQRVGARRWIGRIMITWGLISAMFAWVKSPTAFYVLRFLLGLAEAGFYPGILLYLTYWYPTHRYARNAALFVTAIPLSGIVGNPLSGWIMDHSHGLGGLHGWQWMFLIEALPAVVLGVVVLLLLDDGIGKARWLTASERDTLAAALVTDRAEKKGPHRLATALADGRVWLLCVIYFTLMAGLYGVTFWLPTFVAATGVKGNTNIGLIAAIPNLVAIVVMVLTGRSGDRHRERRWHVAIPASMAGLGFALAATASSPVISIVGLSLAAAGVMTCTAVFWSLPTAFLGETGAAAGLATINSVGNLGGFCSPILVGYLRDLTHDNRAPMLTIAAGLVLGAVLIFRLPAKLVNR
jgi:MFS family permease